MIIKRVYNNNVALATDEQGREVVVAGRGLCFSRRPGDELDAGLVEKVFSLESPSNLGRFEKLARSIPSEYLIIAEDIVEMLRQESDLTIDDGILIALADHINLSLEREKRGIALDNPLLVEIKQYYKREFALAQRAAGIIHDHLGFWVSEEETGFIALHIVNATMNERQDRLIRSIEMIKAILGIVESAFDVHLDPDSLLYERFLRHLQFFAQRVLDTEGLQAGDDVPVLLERESWPRAFACADTIAAFVEDSYGIHVTKAERGYLVYHLVTLLGPDAR